MRGVDPSEEARDESERRGSWCGNRRPDLEDRRVDWANAGSRRACAPRDVRDETPGPGLDAPAPRGEPGTEAREPGTDAHAAPDDQDADRLARRPPLRGSELLTDTTLMDRLRWLRSYPVRDRDDTLTGVGSRLCGPGPDGSSVPTPTPVAEVLSVLWEKDVSGPRVVSLVTG